MDEGKLKEELIRYEGCKTEVYLDTMGLPTCGIGHMDRNMIVGQHVSPSVIDMFYKQDTRAAFEIAHRIECFNSLDEVRQRILVQLCFNLGTKILMFKKMLAALNAGKYAIAADELQNSAWFGQVGKRGPETCFALRTGEYGWRN